MDISIVLYIIILSLFFIAEKRRSINRTLEKLSPLDLPIDKGVFIAKATLVLFLIHETYVLFVLKQWIMLIIPYVIVRFNAPLALKKALRIYVLENLKAGISEKESLRMASFLFNKDK